MTPFQMTIAKQRKLAAISKQSNSRKDVNNVSKYLATLLSTDWFGNMNFLTPSEVWYPEFDEFIFISI